jgi:hypothetical protein
LTQPILRIALSVSSSPVSQFDAKSPPGWVHEAAAGGALGGTLVSGALWGPWWQVPAWIAALVATAIAPTLALSGQPLGFMVGWSLFWGLLIGAVAMWGAQLDGAGWAYGIAGGIGFFVSAYGHRLEAGGCARAPRAARKPETRRLLADIYTR